MGTTLLILALSAGIIGIIFVIIGAYQGENSAQQKPMVDVDAATLCKKGHTWEHLHIMPLTEIEQKTLTQEALAQSKTQVCGVCAYVPKYQKMISPEVFEAAKKAIATQKERDVTLKHFENAKRLFLQYYLHENYGMTDDEKFWTEQGFRLFETFADQAEEWIEVAKADKSIEKVS